MKSDFELFAYRMRNLALTKPYRSERYKTWLRERFPNADDPHHIFGSTMGMKSTDLMSIAVTRLEHSDIQHKPVTPEQVLGAVSNLMEYIKYLEAQ